MIPVVVISLARSQDRRAAMTERMRELGIPFTFFDAVDGYALTAADMKALRVKRDPHGHEQDPGVVGCYASHAEVCRRIADGPDEFVCVLEDDAVLLPDARIFLDAENLKQLPRFDILRLNDSARGLHLPLGEWRGYPLFASYRPTVGAFAFIYSRAGAARTARHLSPIRMGIDLVLFTHGIVPRLRIIAIRHRLSYALGLDRVPSTIDSHQQGFAREAPRGLDELRRRLFLLTARFRVYRNFVSLWGFRALGQLTR